MSRSTAAFSPPAKGCARRSKTVGRGGRKPAKTDANRLKNVKQLLVNAATIERFRSQPTLPQLDGQYSRWIGKINDAWVEFGTVTFKRGK